jgi:hypothetical protein
MDGIYEMVGQKYEWRGIFEVGRHERGEASGCTTPNEWTWVRKTCIHEFILRGYEAFGRYLRFKICEILYV